MVYNGGYNRHAHLVDGIDIDTSIVPFALDPVSVEVCEHTINIIYASPVCIPFRDIGLKQNVALEVL